jgi:hypothetical protein
VDIDPLRIAERIHGHLGWLAAIALLHPAILLRNRKRKAHLSVGLAVGGISAVFAIGCLIYGAYRDKLRQALFQQARPIGFLFERKEHLAFGALLLAWAGALAYFAAGRADGPTRDSLRKAAHWAFVAASVLAVVTASLGIIVAAFRSF